MRNFLTELRHAVRALRSAPAFTAAAVVCIALGVGANTAIFSVLRGVLLEPPPYEEPERLVMLWEHNTVRNVPRNVVGPANFVRWRERATSFEGMGLFFRWSTILNTGGEPERLPVGVSTGDFFEILGVEALQGRVYGMQDVEDGAEDVVVVSHDFWQTKLGGTPDVIGTVLDFAGDPTTVIGVIDPEVQLPEDVDLWAPFRLTERHRQSRGRWAQAVARLRPDVSLEAAQAEMTTIAAGIAEESPDFNAGWSVRIVGLQDDIVRDVRTPILTLTGAVGFVLLIACANVANLMLAHGARRRRELAIRAALGAGRFAILRQVLAESLVLAAIGGAAGLLVGGWGMELLTGLARDSLPGLSRIDLDPPVLVFTAGLALVTGLLFGAAPALQAMRPDLVDTLKAGSRSVFGDLRGTWARNGLIVAQVALSLVLLVGAGLLLNSFRRLISVDPGYATDEVLAVDIDLLNARYPEAPAQAQFFAEAIERLEALPDVEAAAAMSWLPIGTTGSATTFRVLDRPEPPAGEWPVADVRAVTPGYFDAMEVPLVRGRDLSPADDGDAPLVVVINRGLAETFWPDEDPLGKRVLMSWGDPAMEGEVVGVVEDARLTRLDSGARATLYWAHAQLPYDFMTLMVRYRSPRPPTAAVRAQIRAIDPEQPITAMRTLDEVVSRSLARERLMVSLLGAFSLLALCLAAVGIYGVISYATSQRTQEFGVRMALGARGVDVLRQVLAQGLRLAAVGVLAGIAAALALTRLIRGLLFEVSPTDPTTIAVVVSLLLGAMLAACWIPARRATRVDPVTALRCD